MDAVHTLHLYDDFMEDSHHRIVVQRTKVKYSTPDLFGDRYNYCKGYSQV